MTNKLMRYLMESDWLYRGGRLWQYSDFSVCCDLDALNAIGLIAYVEGRTVKQVESDVEKFDDGPLTHIERQQLHAEESV